MEWLYPAAAANVAAALALSLVYAYLWTVDRRKELWLWAVAWVLYATRFVVMLSSLEYGASRVSKVLYLLLVLGAGLFLLQGSACFLKRKLSARWFGAFLGCSVCVLVAPSLDVPFVYLQAPVFFLVGWAFIYTGIAFIRYNGTVGGVARWLGSVLIIWGLHKWDYPFLRGVESFALVGYILGAILALLTAIGFILTHFQVMQHRLKALAAHDMSQQKEAMRAVQASEERYRLLMRASRAISIELSLDGIILSFDGLAQEVTGYRAKDVVGKSFLDVLVPPLQRGKLEERLVGLVAGDSLFHVEVELLIRGEFGRQILLNGVLRKDEQGEPAAILLAGLDVTELRVAQRRRSETERRLHEIIEQAKLVIFEYGTSGNLRLVSENVEEFAGISRNVLLSGQVKWVDLIHPDDRKRYLDTWRETAETGIASRVEYRLRHDMTGEEIFLEQRNVVQLRQGDSQGILAVCIDVQSRRQAELEAERIQEQLLQSEKIRVVGQLAGGVAHDFNNLLSAITGGAELLKMNGKASKEKQMRYLDMILEAAESAAGLNQQLLSFVRKEDLSCSSVDMHLLLQRVEEMLQHALEKRVDVVLQLEAKSAFISGDEDRLQNMLMNLALNARDAMPDGGRLAFRTSNRSVENPDFFGGGEACPGDYLLIDVEDTGSGIPEEMQRVIFEPFFTTKSEGKGTGLGLASVFSCLASHRGGIDVKSRPEKGTVFTLYLPVEVGPKDIERPVQTKELRTGSAHILVLDDEPLIREQLADSLGLLGYRVTCCSSGSEALECYEKEKGLFDLVILDMMMPGMNGLEVLERLRELDPEVRAILASGYAGEKRWRQIEELGVAGVLRKPLRMQVLAEGVATVLQGGRFGMDDLGESS